MALLWRGLSGRRRGIQKYETLKTTDFSVGGFLVSTLEVYGHHRYRTGALIQPRPSVSVVTLSAGPLIRLEFDGLRSIALRRSLLFDSRRVNNLFASACLCSILCKRAVYPTLINLVQRVISICVFLFCLASSTAVAQYRFDVLNTSKFALQNKSDL